VQRQPGLQLFVNYISYLFCAFIGKMRFVIKVQAVLRHQRCQVTRSDPGVIYNIKAVCTNNINPAVSPGVFMDQKNLGLWFCTEASKFDA